VTRIDIHPAKPPFEGLTSRWQHAARAVGLHHATTRDGVIDAFLQLDVGDICTELRRAESERVLRAQPFLAAATVRAEPDGGGGVVLVVETVDEVPVLVNARFQGIRPQAASLGNGNVGGEALLLEGRVERGFAYRTAFGGRVISYATFGRPYVLSFDGDRERIGHFINTSLEHPFYTDLQRVGWYLGFGTSHGYAGILRPAGDPLALGVRHQRWEASSLSRVFGTSTVTLLGLGASGLRVTPETQGVVISDTGLTPDTGATLRNRYLPFKTTRLGVLGGVRHVTFRTVRGFDALKAQQDVASGVMTGLFVAHGLPSLGASDLFLSGAAYAGTATDHTLLATLAQVEGRRPTGGGTWDSVIGSGRAAFYLSGAGMLFTVDDRFSGGLRSRLPLQLAMGDWQGGLLGYHSSWLAGAARNVARAEVRWSRAAAVRNADVGVATFSQVGSIWKGDAPYGTTATRANVGLSLLATYPSRSKRIYRVDLGIPVVRGQGGSGIEVRFSNEDRTHVFWQEPDDLSRSRTGAVPSTLFAWPSR
jgi:hypothetical protein